MEQIKNIKLYAEYAYFNITQEFIYCSIYYVHRLNLYKLQKLFLMIQLVKFNN